MAKRARAKNGRFFNDGSIDPASQFELDAAWNAAFSQEPTRAELRCAAILAEMEAADTQLASIPTWVLERND